jgi:sialate O-acetylesterase
LLPRFALVTFAAIGLASAASPALAQPGSRQEIKLKEPVASRVYQRDINGYAEIPIVPESSDAKVVDASVNGGHANRSTIKFADGKLTGVPVGGPYTIQCQVRVHDGPQGVTSVTVGPVYVGDLWVLAGQSNMEGVGDLIDVAPPHPRVMMLGMDGQWKQAEEPLHWLVDSPDPVHSGDPQTREQRSAQTHKNRRKGAGLGLAFATALTEATGVPIGLVICAHGGTNMEQWNPARKDQGGRSLYGSMMRQFQLAGGKVKGLLWYQGESDANGDASKRYHQVFSRFIGAVRSDFGQPELPFYFVQIGRFVRAGDSSGWNTVQEAQRRLPERVPNTAVISVIDLELDDAIHVGTQGLKRAGHRLARMAERELFGQVGATTPTLDSVAKGPNNTLVVRFKGVNMGLATAGTPMRGRMMGAMAAGAGTAGGEIRSVQPGGTGAFMSQNPASSDGESAGFGLRPDRHIAGFTIRKEDGSDIPLIFEARVGKARDTVVLKLAGAVPPRAVLWYGYGYDPNCNLTDSADMAVPVFGPIPLDDALGSETARAAAAPARPASAELVKALIITGDTVSAHKWALTTQSLQDMLAEGGRIKVDVTTTASKDLTDENLAKYDVLILNYKDTPAGPPESRWTEANKDAFLKAVRGGKGLVVFHHASSAFIRPNWDEFEKAVAGGWRAQGFHGPPHAFTVKKSEVKHPISEGLPATFDHEVDELYQNSMITPGSEVLATAYSDDKKPRGTGKDEPVIWVNRYGNGRVYENTLGHDVRAMADPNFQKWMRRGVIWAATGQAE